MLPISPRLVKRNGNLTENPWAFNAGDTTTPTGQKYEYDEENRLTRVKRLTSPPDQVLLEIGYDAVGRRVESKEYLDAQTGQILATARVTHHVVLGPMTIEEYTITAGPTATLAREFVWGTEFPMPVAIVDWTAAGQVGAGQAEVLHHLRDVLGNVVALTDASGNVVERYRYDPYGMTHIYTGGGALLPASAYGNPYAFTGQRYDAAVGLYHFWFRTYSPALGRWHQRDPAGYADSVSLHAYCVTNPLNRLDPTGRLSPSIIGGLVGGGIGGLGGFMYGIGQQTMRVAGGLPWEWGPIVRSTGIGALGGAATGVLIGGLTGDPIGIIAIGGLTTLGAITWTGGCSFTLGAIDGSIDVAEELWDDYQRRQYYNLHPDALRPLDTRPAGTQPSDRWPYDPSSVPTRDDIKDYIDKLAKERKDCPQPQEQN